MKTNTIIPRGTPTTGVAKELTSPAVPTPANVEKIKGIAIAINDEATPERLKRIINKTATITITNCI